MATHGNRRWLQIARKEIGDAYRSWRLQLLVAFFALLGAGVGYFADQNLVQGLVLLLVFLAPLVGISFTQHTIVQKRTDGELAVLLGLPFSRRDLIVGTYVGRTGLLLVSLTSVLVSTMVFGSLSGSRPPLDGTVAAFAMAAVLGTIFVGLAVGISATVRTGAAASVAAFGAYLLFAFQIWALIPDGILYLSNGFSFPETVPTWALVFEQLSPFAVVRNAAAAIVPDLAATIPLVAAPIPEEPPLYMHPLFATLVALLWLALPAALGYAQFERTDL